VVGSWPIPTVLRHFVTFLRRNPRPIRDALIVIGIVRAVFYYTVQGRDVWNHLGIDAAAYWGIDLAHPYQTGNVGDYSAYLYSPAFAQVVSPFSAIPFPVFYGVWLLLSVLALSWLVRPWPWAIPIFALPISMELMTGQVQLFFAAAIVLGFRRPALWALPILTKVVPGIGLLWFVIRQEWRALAEAVGVTLVVVAVSFVLAPTAWFDWFTFLRANAGSSEAFLPRLVIAVALVAFGARTDRRWLVPVAVWISLPVVWVSSWVILLAVIRLLPAEGDATSPIRDRLPNIGSRQPL